MALPVGGETKSGPESSSVFLEAESFADKGGWVVDQQFMDQMGSPYLLAHGMGNPVADAVTAVEIPAAGDWHVYVRTYNWTSPWTEYPGPGKFKVKIGKKTLKNTLGNTGNAWEWQYAGNVRLGAGRTTVALSDLTGFEGRCDAIYLTTDRDNLPPSDVAGLEIFRRQMLGLPEPDTMTYDFVVVGGGIAGMCAAVAAARLGCNVALVNDRPVLGGNNSSEVRVHLGGYSEVGPNEGLGRMIREFGHTIKGNAQPASNYEDDRKQEFIDAEENITLFANYHATDVRMDGDRIEAVRTSKLHQIIDVQTDEKRMVSLYFADYKSRDCQMVVDVIDATTKRVLHSNLINSFPSGMYLKYNVNGHVQFRLTRFFYDGYGNPDYPVCSGVFIDEEGVSGQENITRENDNLRCYPSVFRDNLTIEADVFDSRQARIQIHSMTGSLLYDQTVDVVNQKVGLSLQKGDLGISSGICIVSLVTDRHTLRTKVVCR